MAARAKRLSLNEVIDSFFADQDSESEEILLQNEHGSPENSSSQDSEWEYCSSSDDDSETESVVSIPSKRKTSSPRSDQPAEKRFVSDLSPISEAGADLDNDDYAYDLDITTATSDSSRSEMSPDNSTNTQTQTVGVNEIPEQDETCSHDDGSLNVEKQMDREKQGRGQRGRGHRGRGQRGRGQRGRGQHVQGKPQRGREQQGRGQRGRGQQGRGQQESRKRGRGQRSKRQQSRKPSDEGQQVAQTDEEDTDERKWTKVQSPNDFTPVNIPFIGKEGLKVRIKDDASPIDFFDLYITQEIIELLVIETNRYAKQYIASKGDTITKHSNVKNWKETDEHEMRTFLGLLLLMGIIYKPRINMYWSTDEIFSTPVFSQVMARDRFHLLLKFLHFSNNDDPTFDPEDENRDRLHKVRPLINMIRQRCKKIYYPGRNLSVDESLVLFKGRLAFKQYIKTKRARFGIKLYELCSSNGVTLDFFVYCGKGFLDDQSVDELPKEFTVTEKIPAKLMPDFDGNGHCVFVDNFYTSPRLAEYMLDNNTHLCGTIKRGRCNYSKDIVAEELEKGTAVFYKSERLLACKYRAAKNKSNNQPKIVYTLSTAHPATMEPTDKKDKHDNPIKKPSLIIEYNHQMGGVDLVDQHAYHTLRKTYKWYRKLALRLIMQCILNSHKVYQKHTGNQNDLLSFMHTVVACLLVSSPRLNKEICLKDTVHRLTGRHFPMKKKPNPGTKDPNPTKYCRVCYARGVKTSKGAPLKTVYICKTCPSQPGLHIEDCFELYHTILDFSV